MEFKVSHKTHEIANITNKVAQPDTQKKNQNFEKNLYDVAIKTGQWQRQYLKDFFPFLELQKNY